MSEQPEIPPRHAFRCRGCNHIIPTWWGLRKHWDSNGCVPPHLLERMTPLPVFESYWEAVPVLHGYGGDSSQDEWRCWCGEEFQGRSGLYSHVRTRNNGPDPTPAQRGPQSHDIPPPIVEIIPRAAPAARPRDWHKQYRGDTPTERAAAQHRASPQNRRPSWED